MTITAGQRLGPYEIVAPLGAGGMGEVWRAHDTRLDRSVAIKVLPAEFAQNAQLRARFEREAKSISQLNHPNICTLYDIGREGNVDYLVMELVDGETLADRIGRGPLPLGDVLRIGTQIADALDRAHSAGIVHRDLKPGNIMLTKSGAKLLDFGLAKGGVFAISNDGATQHKSLTEEGTIVGTFQYMSPEQLEGADVDPRTDIFALGAVLYEMLTGHRAFDGKNRTSLIAAIVSSEPKPIQALQPLTPPALEHVVAKCLAKERDERWQSARDIAGELRWITETRTGSGERSVLRRSRRARPWMLAAAGLLLALVATTTAAVLLMRRHSDPPMTLSLTMPPGALLFFSQAALSPDGNTIAFIGWTKEGPSLWVRPLAERAPRALPQTNGALLPFWSPDGASIGFFADDKLRRIALSGGPPQTVCDAPSGMGGSWSREGVIVFGSGNNAIFRVDANGGKAQPVTRVAKEEEGHRFPSFLPDGDHFVYLGDASTTAAHHIKVGSLRDGSSKTLFQGVTNALFVEPDHLFFIRNGALLVQRLDLKALALTGEPRVLAEQVAENYDNHHREFSAAPNGRLLYRAASDQERLLWVDRTGKTIENMGEPRRLSPWFHLSPDQQRAAVGTRDADGRPDDIWLVDRARQIHTRLTFNHTGDTSPVWSPDGTRIAFQSMRASLGDVYATDVANPMNVRRLTTSRGNEFAAPAVWTHSDTLILERWTADQADIVLYSFKSGTTQPYLATPFSETEPALSSDERWIAYVSAESGRGEIYVEEFPSHAHRRQVTSGGGVHPMWRPGGHELFFANLGQLMSVVDATDEKSTPAVLFHLPGQSYEPAADGQRFLIDQPVEDVTTIPMTVVTNWRGEKD